MSAAEPASSSVEAPLTPPEAIESFATILRYEEGAAAGTEDSARDDSARFEKFAAGAAKAGYNTILCGFREGRITTCNRHGLKLMLDLAPVAGPGLDIRKPDQREKLRELLASWSGEKAVWGYSLANPLNPGPADQGKELNAAVALTRSGDSVHPVFVAASDFQAFAKTPGTIGVLAWDATQGPWDAERHWKMLASGEALSRDHIDTLGLRLALDKDLQKTRFQLHTAIAFGIKAVLWGDGGAIDLKSGNVDEKHGHAVVQGELRHSYRDLAEIDRPQAVYSTPTTRTWDDREKPRDVPAPLTPFPAKCWVEVTRGEVLVGCFKHDTGYEALFVANHNSRRAQGVTIHVKRGDDKPTVEHLDRPTGEWKPLAITDDTFSLEIPAAGGELIRLLHVASE